MKKATVLRLAAMILALCILFAISACTAKTATKTSSSNSASSNNANTTDTSAASTGDSAAASDTYKIGAFLCLSGGNAAFGLEARDAIQMAVDMINAEGGFNGQTVEFIAYDSLTSPEEAVKIVNKMITEDKINACIGSIISSEVLAAGPFLNEAKIVTVGLGTSPSWMEEDWPYIFRASMNSAFGMGIEADMLVELGLTDRIACFYSQDDSALSTLASFKSECANRGITIVAEETHDAGDTDYSAQIANIIAADPQCVWFATDGQVTPLFVKQLRQYGYTGIVMDKEAFANSMVAIAGEAASNNLMWANPYVTYKSIDDCDIPVMKDFLQLYSDKYGQLPQTECTYRGWDSIKVLWEAAKVSDSNDADAMRNAIGTLKYEGLGGQIDFTVGDREGYHAFNSFFRAGGKDLLFSSWLENGGYDAYKTETGNEF